MAAPRFLKKLFKRKKANKKLKKNKPKAKKTARAKKPSKKSARKKRPVKKSKAFLRVKKAEETIKGKKIGVITHFFGKISVGIIKLSAPLNVGDKVRIKGAHDDFSQIVGSMQFNHQPIASAKKGLEVGIEVTQRVHENDKVYKEV